MFRQWAGFADFNEPRYKQNLPFQKVEHKVATLDAQPSNESGGILVMVTGALLVRTLLFSNSRTRSEIR